MHRFGLGKLVPACVALAAACAFAPATYAASAAGPVSATASAPAAGAAPSVITLVTGERVQLTHDDAGHLSATLLDVPGGATSGPRQVQVFSAAGHTYVVPQEAAGDLGRLLDPSLFDIAAQQADPTPHLDVQWQAGATSRTIPGVTSGEVTDPAAFGGALRAGALDGVARISRADAPVTVTPNFVMSTLVVRGIDARGKKASFGTVYVVNMDDTARFASLQSFDNGTVSFSVPRGTYNLAVAINTSTSTGAYVSDALIVSPQVVVGGSQTVVVADARDATVHVPVPKTTRPSNYYMFQAWVGRTTLAGNRMEYTDQLVLGDLNFYVQPTPPVTVGTMRWFDYFRLVSPDGAVTPYVYDLGQVADGVVPRHFPNSVSDGSLAHIRATYHSDTPDRLSYVYRNAWQPHQTVDFSAVTPMTAPVTRDEYVSGLPDVMWNQNLVVNADEFNPVVTETQTAYEPGQQSTVSWSKAITHPGLNDPPGNVVRCLACRQGDRFTFNVNPWTDAQPGHYVQQWFNSSTLTTSTAFQLLENGVPLASGSTTAAGVNLDPAPATYQLSVNTTKSAPWWASDSASQTVWTWSSAERAGTVPSQRTCRDGTQNCSFEPLIFLDESASVDQLNSVAAGSVATLDVYAHHQLFDTTSPAVSGLDAAISLDHGATWTAAMVADLHGGHYRAQVLIAPGATGSVWTRIRATDAAGDQVEDTTADAFWIGEPPAGTGGGTPPPPPGSGSGVRRACAQAPAPRAACQAEIATAPAQSQAGADVPAGYGPAQLQSAYQLPSATGGHGRTVAVVDAFDDPQAEADLANYRAQFGLPACTSANGCFQKVNQSGAATPLPVADAGWALEISLDLDMVSAACPNCDILLVEADSNDLADLGASVDTAVREGADVVSNSYAANEFPAERRYEKYYNHAGHAIVASSGDFGYGTMYPAASRYVTAAGGTSLTPAGNARGWDESVWSGAGSGCSAYIAKPSWQHDPNCPMRMVADASAVADPNTGVAVYDTYVFDGWQVVGGTSVSAPLIGATYALNGRADTYQPADLYRKARPGQFWDVTSGTNVPGQTASTCGGDYLCTGLPGYDGPTGWGTPHTAGAF